ncbi:MAG: TIM barrel protein [Prolixibacteraceae bacterium]
MEYNRRKFVQGVATTAALLPFSSFLASAESGTKSSKYPIMFFTKPLDGYDSEFLAETLAMAGVDGFDLQVRPGGRVDPKTVKEELPKMVELGKKHQLATGMMVTAIRDTTDPYAEDVLKVAAKCGIKHYRLGYYDYDFKKGVMESLAEIGGKLGRLSTLNKELGIQAGYQNHSGSKVGAPLWDVWELTRHFPTECISSQFDIRHAVTEGAASWIISMNLLKKNIGSLAFKDFTWGISGRKAKVVSVPLGEGIIDFDLFFQTIKDLNIDVPITLHAEYSLLETAEEKLPLLKQQQIIVTKLKKDVEFIRTNLSKFKLI